MSQRCKHGGKNSSDAGVVFQCYPLKNGCQQSENNQSKPPRTGKHLRRLTGPPRGCKRTGANGLSSNVLGRCSHSAFGHPHLNEFSEETLCPVHKRQLGRKAGFE